METINSNRAISLVIVQRPDALWSTLGDDRIPDLDGVYKLQLECMIGLLGGVWDMEKNRVKILVFYIGKN
jgi:hypothetical protein